MPPILQINTFSIVVAMVACYCDNCIGRKRDVPTSVCKRRSFGNRTLHLGSRGFSNGWLTSRNQDKAILPLMTKQNVHKIQKQINMLPNTVNNMVSVTLEGDLEMQNTTAEVLRFRKVINRDFVISPLYLSFCFRLPDEILNPCKILRVFCAKAKEFNLI